MLKFEIPFSSFDTANQVGTRGFHIICISLACSEPSFTFFCEPSSKQSHSLTQFYDCEGSVNQKTDFEALRSQTTIFPFSEALARMCGTIRFQLMLVMRQPSWKFGSPGLKNFFCWEISWIRTSDPPVASKFFLLGLNSIELTGVSP